MAIGAQLDATRINAGLNISLTRASSNELQEVLGEDTFVGWYLPSSPFQYLPGLTGLP